MGQVPTIVRTVVDPDAPSQLTVMLAPLAAVPVHIACEVRGVSQIVDELKTAGARPNLGAPAKELTGLPWQVLPPGPSAVRVSVVTVDDEIIQISAAAEELPAVTHASKFTTPNHMPCGPYEVPSVTLFCWIVVYESPVPFVVAWAVGPGDGVALTPPRPD